MELNDLKRKLIGFYLNSFGWRTNRKIIVIESDDWGCIRMPSTEIYNSLLSKGYPVDKLPYLKYDSLETKNDFDALFDVLRSFKDKNGNHPIITANTIVTNPNFGKIKASGFNEYIYELFTDTLKNESNNNTINYYFEGIKEKVFFPQLHGREHLNVNRWMKSLQNNTGLSRVMFDNKLFDLSESETEISENSFVDTLSPATIDELPFLGNNIKEAAQIFEQIFGFKSKSFIAPCYIWRPETETAIKDAGITYIQSGAYQKVPEIGKINSFTKKFHFTGQKNKSGQIYTVRNCLFEPSLTSLSQTKDHCLSQIEKAFSNKKPAIISSHRINFMGSLVEENRTKNLKLFKTLFQSILTKWPDVEFMHTEQLGNLISKNEQ
jgi:hypothetical protein